LTFYDAKQIILMLTLRKIAQKMTTMGCTAFTLYYNAKIEAFVELWLEMRSRETSFKFCIEGSFGSFKELF
jgi:hypothetical protein